MAAASTDEEAELLLSLNSVATVVYLARFSEQERVLELKVGRIIDLDLLHLEEPLVLLLLDVLAEGPKSGKLALEEVIGSLYFGACSTTVA
ncbi:hypothetical protein HPB50_019925 [Hyalomma asiaticum]|uniref:Uncharacterized protein n=1 Tax=Hyalomma asiaticum TaxID=266040 RepID=A0ACB7RMG2_HYAAI|nr:hypothetical protein HPB50_019925 [Hyalomma asiaticum]